MKKLYHKRDGAVRVINCVLTNGRQLSFLANDKRILCYRHRPNIPWEPVAEENLRFAASINRL